MTELKMISAARTAASRRGVTIALAVALAVAGSAAYSLMTIHQGGSTRTVLAGVAPADAQLDFNKQGSTTNFALLSVSMGVTTSREAASGRATGKRQHAPLVLTHRVDGNTPLIYAAVVGNESLKSATITFGGLTIKLTNATVGEDKITYQGNDSTEQFSLYYQKIEIRGFEKSATDDWTTGP